MILIYYVCKYKLIQENLLLKNVQTVLLTN